MKVRVKDFIAVYCDGEGYRHGIYVPTDIFERCCELDMRSALDGVDYSIEVPDNIDEIINDAKHRDELREKQYNDASALRIAGMTDEQNGDTDSAIANYAEAIEVGEASEFDLLHAYHHAYNRIIILLSRTRAYAREAEYIERLLKHSLQDDERERMTARLQKAKAKLEKLK